MLIHLWHLSLFAGAPHSVTEIIGLWIKFGLVTVTEQVFPITDGYAVFQMA